MARTRTTPATPTLPDLTGDRVVSFGVRMVYDDAGAIDKERSRFEYNVENIDENGKVAGSHRYEANINDWSTGLRTDLKAVRDDVLAHAEAQGFIGAGSDAEDLDPAV